MKRRKFLVGGLAGAAVLAASCSKPRKKKTIAPAVQTKIKWRMATTWPKIFPVLHRRQ